MKKYISPAINSYGTNHLLEYFGPAQSASVNVQIRATAFNTTPPSINKYVAASEYNIAIAKIHRLEQIKTEIT